MLCYNNIILYHTTCIHIYTYIYTYNYTLGVIRPAAPPGAADSPKLGADGRPFAKRKTTHFRDSCFQSSSELGWGHTLA